ncbi:MAG: phosphopentomutase [Candidatus Buchananbacteria bacterium]|nr:phosphopentomutase [Candidatus Buchananbacteria bacterium]
MDSVGIGAQPDASIYDSEKAHTFSHVANAVANFSVPNLSKLGFGNITNLPCVPPTDSPSASWGKMCELTSGIDTFAGIWEMAGVIYKDRFASFKPSIPSRLLVEMQAAIESNTLCNSYISGFLVLDSYFQEHQSTGHPIVYTCDDGTVLVAAHEDTMSPSKLHTIAERMAKFFVGRQVTRIIARPFVGKPGNLKRTANRRDFVVQTDQGDCHLFARLQQAEIPLTLTEHLTSLIGQQYSSNVIKGIFDSVGIMAEVKNHMASHRPGVAMFVVPDFDMSGHRKDAKQYAHDLMSFDSLLGPILNMLEPSDLLVITADHGCDPTLPVRGHTREYVPLLVTSKNATGKPIGNRTSFADLGQTICNLYSLPSIKTGDSFINQLPPPYDRTRRKTHV